MTLPPPQPLSAYPNSPDSSPSRYVVQQFYPTNITAAWPPIVTAPNHGLQNGQTIRATKFVTMPFSRATGMQQLNNRLFNVQQATTDTFALYDTNNFPIDGRNYTPYIVDNNLAQFTLVGQDLFIENPSFPPPPGIPAFPPA